MTVSRIHTTRDFPQLFAQLRHYATRAGLEIIAEYVDVAVSGRKEGRPQLQALMRSARDHGFACVLVWKFDRFARSVSHLLRALEEFHHLGIRFISVQDQVDTESPIGKAMFTVIGTMAELESSLISERVKAGMEAARARGKHLGRPATPPHLVAEWKPGPDDGDEYSSDQGCTPSHSKPLGRGAHREACPRTVKRGIAVTGFYTYPDVVGESGRKRKPSEV